MLLCLVQLNCQLSFYPQSRTREICVSDQTWPPSGHLSEPAASVSVQTSDLTKATKLLKPIHLERLPLLQKILFPNGADVSGALSSEQAKKKNETCDDTLSHLAEKRRNVRSSVSKRSCQLNSFFWFDPAPLHSIQRSGGAPGSSGSL